MENKTKSQKDAVLFIKQKLDGAKWFIDAIKQRQQTLTIIDVFGEHMLQWDSIGFNWVQLSSICFNEYTIFRKFYVYEAMIASQGTRTNTCTGDGLQAVY